MVSDVGSGTCKLTNQSTVGIQEVDLNDTVGAETKCQTEETDAFFEHWSMYNYFSGNPQ